MRVYGTCGRNWGRGSHPNLVGGGPGHRLGGTHPDPDFDPASVPGPADQHCTVGASRGLGPIAVVHRSGQGCRVRGGTSQSPITGPATELPDDHGRTQRHQQDDHHQRQGLGPITPQWGRTRP
ncbi:MAG: hypothetical protein GY698_05250 [Actinomycetia bacterium]|nr:hypothetical protein [Actinomycetes bacterium]